MVPFLNKARRAAAGLWPRRKRARTPVGSTNRIDETARQSVEDLQSRPPRSTQDRKVDRLVQRDDGEARRLDLDRIDKDARATNTWGSSEHRRARDQREREHTARRQDYEGLSEEEMDQSLGTDGPRES